MVTTVTWVQCRLLQIKTHFSDHLLAHTTNQCTILKLLHTNSVHNIPSAWKRISLFQYLTAPVQKRAHQPTYLNPTIGTKLGKSITESWKELPLTKALYYRARRRLSTPHPPYISALKKSQLSHCLLCFGAKNFHKVTCHSRGQHIQHDTFSTHLPTYRLSLKSEVRLWNYKHPPRSSIGYSIILNSFFDRNWSTSPLRKHLPTIPQHNHI
jgi:hypothetical protein